MVGLPLAVIDAGASAAPVCALLWKPAQSRGVDVAAPAAFTSAPSNQAAGPCERIAVASSRDSARSNSAAQPKSAVAVSTSRRAPLPALSNSAALPGPVDALPSISRRRPLAVCVTARNVHAPSPST